MCEPKRFRHGLPGWHKEVGDREAAIAEATGANPGPAGEPETLSVVGVQGSVAALSDVRSTVSSAQSNQQEAGSPTSQVSSLLQPRKYFNPCKSGKMIIGICHY